MVLSVLAHVSISYVRPSLTVCPKGQLRILLAGFDDLLFLLAPSQKKKKKKELKKIVVPFGEPSLKLSLEERSWAVFHFQSGLFYKYLWRSA